jgi:DNA-binding NarL/FixJ family response regulator
VDDHQAISAGVPVGLAGLLEVAGDSVQARNVDELLAAVGEFDVVLLDIRLNDGTEPEDNVRRLVERGWPVLVYTADCRPSVLGRCLQSGAMGVVGKHEDWEQLAVAVASVRDGEEHLNADWAAAVQALVPGRIPDLASRECEVLKLYAAGLPMKSVARRAGIAEETAKEYLSRIRGKYLAAGRPAATKTDLYFRAVEDGHLPPPGETS